MAARKRIHVQIALVGGQPTPVYQGIVHLKPDQVVLICSESSEDMAKNIKRQLPSYSEKNVLIYPISDTNLEKMYNTAEMIEGVLPKGITISLNLTGGMKLWMFVFNNVFRRKRRSCRFFFIGQGCRYFDLKTKTDVGKVDFDMETQFKILGHQLNDYVCLSDYTTQDYAVGDDVHRMGVSRNTHEAFKELTAGFVKAYTSDNSNLPDFKSEFDFTNNFGSLKWDPKTSSFQCVVKCLSKEGKPMSIRKKWTSEHAAKIVLNTGWFELYVARLISSKIPSSQIRLNCLFSDKRYRVKNEVDIIVNTGDKLIFVECKTQVKSSTDVDKFQSVVHNYGGLGSKHLFVTNWIMNTDAKEKCDNYGITTFHCYDPAFQTEEQRNNALGEILKKLNAEWNYK